MENLRSFINPNFISRLRISPDHSYITMISELNVTIILLALVAMVISAVLALAVLLYFFVRFTTGVCTSDKKMNGKTVIITGCTSGIGKETARDLVKRGARLIMACRNVDTASMIKDEFIKETGNSNVVVKKLDLSSFKSIREFASQINREETRLDVLIHNAGTAELWKKKVTEDGLEMTMQTNMYGPFLLTHLLIDLLKRSAPSRIVVVASEFYHLGSLNLDNPNPVNSLPGYLYYVSKYANIVFTLELARRLQGSRVTANCLHPGVIDSGIWKSVPIPLSWGLKLLMTLFAKTPEQGAQTTLQCAVSEQVEGVTGKYFLDCREYGLTSGVKDAAKGKKFWEICENLTKLQSSDPKI